MYKFLPEQIENLKQQLETKSTKLDAINAIRKSNFLERKSGQTDELLFQTDHSLLGNFIMTTSALNEIKKQLLNCEIIEPNNSDEIGIGSNFEISSDFDGKELTEVFTLVETRLAGDPSNYISVSSPLGKAVIGKKEGDTFRYVVENSIFTGKINQIIKTQENKFTK